MKKILDKKTETVWQKARLINKKTFKTPDVQNSPDEFRLDDFGGIMKLGDYGEITEYGWTVDHILPVAKGGTDNLINLQPLHWKNNASKGDTFFGFEVAVGVTYGSPYKHAWGAPLNWFSLSALEELEAIYPDNFFVREAISTHLSGAKRFVSI
jgi:hypothetical protein